MEHDPRFQRHEELLPEYEDSEVSDLVDLMEEIESGYWEEASNGLYWNLDADTNRMKSRPRYD